MKRILLFSFIACYFATANSQSYFPVPAMKDTAPFRNGIARTASLLTTATKATPRHVKILVYGQSISEQLWWKDVKAFVEKRFPFANITFINKAIGGFSAEKLKLMAENDIISFYPDLILFHDYGNEADYETIIKIIRRNTTAEIALQTDHMAEQNQEWHDKHSQQWLPSMCRKYDLELLDVRTAWKAYLAENNLQIKDLLVDGVHLNEHGNYLMASIIKNYFATLKHRPLVDRYVKTLIAGKDFLVKKARIETVINGNRIDLLWKPAVRGKAPILIYVDGKKSSGFNGCYYYTRPSSEAGGFLKKIGQVLAMTLNGEPREEEWTMTITATDSTRQQMHFSLNGSLTGEDGSGTSERTFTSNSGRIMIDSTQWFRAKEFADYQWIKPGDVLKWTVKCMCKDQVVPRSSAAPTVVQGINNGQHRLVLTGKHLEDLQEIIVYEPVLK